MDSSFKERLIFDFEEAWIFLEDPCTYFMRNLSLLTNNNNNIININKNDNNKEYNNIKEI